MHLIRLIIFVRIIQMQSLFDGMCKFLVTQIILFHVFKENMVMYFHILFSQEKK